MSTLPRQVLRSLRPSSRSFTSSALASSSSTTYVPPIKPGQLRAYDEALLFLSADKEKKLAELEAIKKEGGPDAKFLLEQKEVEAWVNDPETRWRAKNGLGDLSKPVYRHLAELKWRKEGDLAILMQRVTQMNVTPDILPSISPVAEVKISIDGEVIEPGVFRLPSQTREGIAIEAQVFHPEERLYTLLLVDPDVPWEESESFTTFAHLLVPNITLSSTSTTISSTTAALPYIPPHPQRGTPYHRYTALLFAQSKPIDVQTEGLEREGFNVREFAQEHDLTAEGVSFWRAKWQEGVVGQIYQQVLGRVEPVYGRPPRHDPYKDPRHPKYQ
ncbi:PEBP-like protein [Meredithblackwellia eburnea MCA 4105]